MIRMYHAPMDSGLKIVLDRTANTSLAEQIRIGISGAIASGVLAPGARLPSWLDLAAQLGVARGTAVVRFGGRRGRKLRVKAGDVGVLPAGTGHQCFSASKDFLVVGAYPAAGKYDVCRTSPEEHARAIKTVPKVVPPRRDPVYGKHGRLLKLWRRTVRSAA